MRGACVRLPGILLPASRCCNDGRTTLATSSNAMQAPKCAAPAFGFLVFCCLHRVAAGGQRRPAVIAALAARVRTSPRRALLRWPWLRLSLAHRRTMADAGPALAVRTRDRGDRARLQLL